MAKQQTDTNLAKGLSAARKQPRNYALLTKGPNVLGLFVDKNPIMELPG